MLHILLLSCAAEDNTAEVVWYWAVGHVVGDYGSGTGRFPGDDSSYSMSSVNWWVTPNSKVC